MQKVKRIFLIILIMLIFSITFESQVHAVNSAVDLVEGCYTFTSALNDSKCLDVSGAEIKNETNIQIWSSNDTCAQMFYIKRHSTGWYSIHNLESRKALDVAGGIRKSGVNVQLYEWNGTDSQLWKFYSVGNGYFSIRNKLGYYLDVNEGNTSDGTNVQVYQSNGTKSQMWKLLPVQGIYTFTSGVNSGKCLDINGGGTENGTNIQIWSANQTAAQMFLIEKQSSGWYKIQNIVSEKVLDVADGAKGKGVNVQLYEWNGTDAQLWKFYSVGNGYYYIKNKLGYYMDVAGGKTSNGTNIQVYQSNGTKAQMWKLRLANLTQKINDDLLVNFYMDRIPYEEPLQNLMFYYQNFNHKAKYDIKRKQCWNNLFTDIVYPCSNGVVLYNDQVITPEQLGNIIYGFVGNAFGFSDRLIYQGGGYAASGTKYLNDASMYYGDSAMDHEFISIGIKMMGNKPTIDIDLGKCPSWILDIVKNIL